MLDTKTAFKAAFLMKCAEAGLTMEETDRLVAELREKLANWATDVASKALGMGADVTKRVLGPPASLAGGFLATAPVLAPLGIGGLAGYTAAQLTDINDEDAQETKNQELIEELRRAAERARLSGSVRQTQLGAPRSGRPMI